MFMKRKSIGLPQASKISFILPPLVSLGQDNPPVMFKIVLCLSSGKKKGEEDRPGLGLRLAKPGGPTDRFSVLFPFFLPDDESRIQLSKCCDFII
jgi:hypothetical protein